MKQGFPLKKSVFMAPLLAQSLSLVIRICGPSASGSWRVILVVLTHIPIKNGPHLQLVPRRKYID